MIYKNISISSEYTTFSPLFVILTEIWALSSKEHRGFLCCPVRIVCIRPLHRAFLRSGDQHCQIMLKQLRAQSQSNQRIERLPGKQMKLTIANV